MMTLLEVVTRLKQFDNAATIYCREPWSRDAEAIVIMDSGSGNLPQEVQLHNLSYFLEVDVALEMLAGWIENIGSPLSIVDQCDRIIQYAINDA